MIHVSAKGLLGAALIIAPLAANATLGAAPSAPQNSAQTVTKNGSRSTAASYQVQQITEPSGTVVREYVANGIVFGVAWQGPAMPVLRDLFGAANFDHYVQMVEAQRASPNRTRGQVTVAEPGLVVHSGGRPRAFQGQAYIPNLLPSGVVPADIQ